MHGMALHSPRCAPHNLTAQRTSARSATRGAAGSAFMVARCWPTAARHGDGSSGEEGLRWGGTLAWRRRRGLTGSASGVDGSGRLTSFVDGGDDGAAVTNRQEDGGGARQGDDGRGVLPRRRLEAASDSLVGCGVGFIPVERWQEGTA
jgi:hypothetical protein